MISITQGISVLAIGALLMARIPAAWAQQSRQPFATPLESLSQEVVAPVVLCIDDKPLAGGQPSSAAYAKAAMNGFRSVLTLRSKQDGVDLMRERLMVEQNKLRYFNLSANIRLPERKQVDTFLELARDPANQPMLVNCAFAERVAPLMMIFRITEQGWSEDKAVEEASRTGLPNAQLKKFADQYLASRKKARPKSASKS